LESNSNGDLALSMTQSFELEEGCANEIHPAVAAAVGMSCHTEVVARNLNYAFSKMKTTATPTPPKQKQNATADIPNIHH
jgi:hypothetical protein